MASEKIWLITTAILALNALSFVSVWSDKARSMNNTPRTPEVRFFVWSAFFASLGVLLGMYVFRHKVRKFYFVLGIFSIFIQQLLLILYILNLV